jgi:hypothetical protein
VGEGLLQNFAERDLRHSQEVDVAGHAVQVLAVGFHVIGNSFAAVVARLVPWLGFRQGIQGPPASCIRPNRLRSMRIAVVTLVVIPMRIAWGRAFMDTFQSIHTLNLNRVGMEGASLLGRRAGASQSRLPRALLIMTGASPVDRQAYWGNSVDSVAREPSLPVKF